MVRRSTPLVRCIASKQNRPFLSHLQPQVTGIYSNYSTQVQENKIYKSPFSDVTIPNISLSKYIFEAQEEHGGKIALVDGITGQSYTHAQFRDLSCRLGSALTRLDVTHGDIVAIVSPNCPEFPIAFFGVAAIGAVSTTINCSYSAEEIAHQLLNSGASVVITHRGILNKVRDACNIYNGIRHIVVNGPAEEDLLSFQDLLKDDGTAFPHDVKIDPSEDMVVLPYSSGTTGLPKGVMLTHYNLVANLHQLQHPGIDSLRRGEEQEVMLGLLPYFHIYGMVPCMALSLASGSKSITLPTFTSELFISTMEKYKITYLHMVPPIIQFLNNSKLVKPELLQCTRHITSGAAPAGTILLSDFFKKFGNKTFQEGYGMTEASPVTHLTPKDKMVLGSVGCILPNTATKIVDPVTGESLGPNEGEGELIVKGPQVMKGYYRNEEATRNTIDKDGWLYTGDIAQMDSEGNVFIVDRLKELIKVKGLQVAPAELENLIRKHPDVEDVAVIGVPEVRSGEVPRAYVVTATGSNITGEAISEFVENQVAPHKKLSGGVHFLDAIPRAATGKILRRELKALALSESQGEEGRGVVTV